MWDESTKKKAMKSEKVVETVWCGQAIFFRLGSFTFPTAGDRAFCPRLVHGKHILYSAACVVVFYDQYTTVYQNRPVK